MNSSLIYVIFQVQINSFAISDNSCRKLEKKIKNVYAVAFSAGLKIFVQIGLLIRLYYLVRLDCS